MLIQGVMRNQFSLLLCNYTGARKTLGYELRSVHKEETVSVKQNLLRFNLKLPMLEQSKFL